MSRCSRTGRCGDSPGPWIPRIVAWSPCRGATGVRRHRVDPVAWNCGGGNTYRRRGGALFRLREHRRRGLGFWGGGGVELRTQGPGWGLNKGRRPTWACVPSLERPARSHARIPASVARGRETELAAGPGPSAGWGSGRRWRVGPAGQGGRRAARASGRLRERGCGAGRVGAGYWPWAELGRSAALGKGGTGREERVGLGSGLLGFGSWVSFLFYSLFFSFSKSISNKV